MLSPSRSVAGGAPQPDARAVPAGASAIGPRRGFIAKSVYKPAPVAVGAGSA